MRWGIVAGAAAKSGMQTYETLDELERRNKLADKEIELADKRESRAAGTYARELRDENETRAYNKALAGEAPATGLPVARMDLGGPKDAPAAAAAPTPAQDEAAETARAGIPMPAKPATAEKKVAQAAPARGIDPMGDIDRAERAFRANPNAKGAWDNLVKAKATAQSIRVQEDAMRTAEVLRRAQEQTMTIKDHELGRQKAAEGVQAATMAMNAYGEMSDDVAATDPRVWNTTKEVLGTLQSAYQFMGDGKKVTWGNVDGKVVAEFRDTKTNKLLHEKTFETIGQVKDFAQQSAMMTDDEGYKRYIATNQLTKIANELDSVTRATAKNDAMANLQASANKIVAQKTMNKINEAILDPTGKMLIENKDELVQEALAATALNREAFEYDRKVERTLEDGTKEKATVKGNYLLDMIELATPKSTIVTTNAKGEMVQRNIDEQAAKLLANYETIQRDNNFDPNRMREQMMKDLMGRGFDRRLVNYTVQKITEAGDAALLNKRVDAARPGGLQFLADKVIPRGLFTPVQK